MREHSQSLNGLHPSQALSPGFPEYKAALFRGFPEQKAKQTQAERQEQQRSRNREGGVGKTSSWVEEEG